MAPAASFSSSSGASSPVTSPGLSTPSLVQAEEADAYNLGGSSNGPGTHTNSAHHGINGARQPHQKPIAIVGMGCRFPGSAASPAEFWELCSRARSGFMAGTPKNRFNHDAFYHPNAGKTGTYHSQGGYFLDGDLAAFDAPFFSLTEKEAIAMDPQQRLLLECTFEALESAGVPKHSVVGRQVGVFIGGSLSEYETHLSRDSDAMPMYQSTGCAQAMQSNRLSHFFDLRGPSFTLDTACSSSLVALHVACQSIRNGESTIAITGGCHLNMLPDSFISFSTGRLLSDSGRSIAFDERGTGFGRGEGCGIVVLKPLDKALEDKDAIRAVILGTGINQDGKTPGITMPNGSAQEKLINDVYRNAGLDPIDCGFVEAHGTGTKVGDPIEAAAIHRALGQGRSSKDPLYMGSVKSNIGHLEAASGIAGVIKAVLMLERGFLLPNHDFKKPNTKIPWKEWNLKIPTAQRPWPKSKKYVSVNNFGFGGTNAHVVLEKAPFPPKKTSRRTGSASAGGEKASTNSRRLFVLSGNDKQSLEAVMSNLGVYLEQRPEIFQSDLLSHLAYSLSRRSLLKWRVAIPAATSFDLIEALNSSKILPGKVTDSGQGQDLDLRIGFIFTGQGAQWHAMGRELYGQHGYPAYTAALDRADRYLRKLGAKWSLVAELTTRDEQTSKVSEAHISQPTCTAVQLCLVDLLRSWGIRPSAVTGHSSGEIAAAYAAGIIGFESAVAIAYHRGRMIPILKEAFPRLKGSMMAVGGSKEDVQHLLDDVNSTKELGDKGQQIRIACYNSPSSLTISGDSAGIASLEKAIQERQPDTFNRRLQVDVAYHSHHMNLVAKEYREALSSLPQPRSGAGVRFHSSLHGREVGGFECDANYWVDNLTCPVRFCEALESMVSMTEEQQPGLNLLIELGPHSALQGPIKQILQAAGVAKAVSYSTALVRKRDAVETALELAAGLFAKGALLCMDAINFPAGSTGDKAAMLTDLPRYAWNHKTGYWHESRLSQMHTRRSVRSELIGIEAIYSTNLEPTWRNMISLDDLPWLTHHQIQGLVVFPLAGFVAMALEAAETQFKKTNPGSQQQSGFNTFELKDVGVLKPLALPADVVDGGGSIELSISLRRRHDPDLDEDWDEFRICSWSRGTEWNEHCAGLVAIRCHDSIKTATDQHIIDGAISATMRPGVVNTGIKDMYEHLSNKLGVTYGPSFQGIQDCKTSERFSVGTVEATLDKASTTSSTAGLHPTLLESIIEMYWPILGGGGASHAQDVVYLPSSIRHMCVAVDNASAAGVGDSLTAYCNAEFVKTDPRPTSVDIFATSADLTVSIDGLIVSPIVDGETDLDAGNDGPRELCYKLEWEALDDEHIPNGSTPRAGLPDASFALIYGESGSLSHLLAGQLAVALESATSKSPDMEGGLFDKVNSSSSEYVTSNLSDKICIVLTEVDSPFLSNPSEAQFAAVQALAARAKGIMWSVRSAYADATSPQSNMISGLSRTIRSETMMPFATLDLVGSCGLEDTQSVTEAILEVVRAAFGSGTGTKEMEFIYRSGKLLTPRVVHDNDMNEYVHRQTDTNALELQPFGQADAGGRTLRMEFETASPSVRGHGHGSGHWINGVHFVDDDAVSSSPLADDEIEFEVRAVGICTHDILAILDGSSGKSSSVSAGVEASGIVTRVGRAVNNPSLSAGCRIASFTTAINKSNVYGAFATRARTTSSATFPLSSDCSFEQAAALPLPYCTAYYSLVEKARLQSGQSVLITSPSGPVGQATVCLARMIGASVFVAVQSPEEKALLMQQHSDAIAEDHIITVSGGSGLSRSAAHRTALDSILRVTNGEGVDVVLDFSSSRTADQSRQLWTACLACFGCLVQVLEPSLPSNQHPGRSSTQRLHEIQPSSFFNDVVVPKNASFMTVDMLGLASERPKILGGVVAKVAELLKQGKIPLMAPITVFPFSQAHTAFQALQNGERGPLVLVPGANDMVKAPPYRGPSSKKILRADATYIIVGGTGGLGRSMARWMVEHGAGTIVLLSRRATVTPAVEELMNEARTAGAQTFVRQCDVADESSIASLIEWTTAEALPPVRGVIHSAMVLRDVLFEKMSFADYMAVVESKVQGAWNLHMTLDGNEGKDSAKLDFFIAFSSVSAIVGNRGQAAYAAANTFLDALVQYRLARGLPAVSLALAAVSDAGYLADSGVGADRAAEVLRNLGSDSGNTICEAEVLALLRAAVTGETATCHHHVITGVGISNSRGSKQSSKKSLPFWAGDAKFNALVPVAEADADTAEGGNGDAIPPLSSSLSEAEAEDVVCRGLVAKIAQVLMMEPDELDVTRSLTHYPLDSLIAIEIRNFIARQYEASMQVLELLSSGSIQTLSSAVCRKSKLRSTGT